MNSLFPLILTDRLEGVVEALVTDEASLADSHRLDRRSVEEVHGVPPPDQKPVPIVPCTTGYARRRPESSPVPIVPKTIRSGRR